MIPHTEDVIRPAFVALIAAAALALVAGAAIGGDGEPDVKGPAAAATASPGPEAAASEATSARAKEKDLPARVLAGRTVIMRFAGSPEPAYVREALREGRAAGVILFRDNLPDASATRALTRRLQKAGRGRALLMTDQEGGAIRNLSWAPPTASASTLQTADAARDASAAAARGLRSAGINVNLAPVADLGGPGRVMRARAFPGSPAAVARLSAAAVKAYRGTGVAPTAKHFPGLGAATANTDDAAVTIDRPARTIGATDLPPFKAAISAGVPLVMLSHARYPALDGRRIASQSRAVVTDLLKRRLAFEGVAITDSIEAEAVRGRMGPEEAAVRSVRAGIDLVLTTGPGSHLRVYRALRAQARRNPAFKRRLADAAGRVQALRRSVAGRPG